MQPSTLKSLLISLVLLPTILLAETNGSTVEELQREWAVVNYELSGKPQIEAFESLIERADRAVEAQPGSAELLIWNGIIKSSFAGAKGGLGALKMAKAAKASLEAALEIDPRALDGSAYASLGTLYYKVPGWPVGFGSDKKALQLLQKALEINPNGIDPNYFYADFLLEKKEYEKAEQYLLKAQSATPRPGREVADAGRQEEIGVALTVAREKMNRSRS